MDLGKNSCQKITADLILIVFFALTYLP